MKTNGWNVWGRGQLMAYSGLSGQTDFHHDLVLRTDDWHRLRIVSPQEQGEIELGDDLTGLELTSETIRWNGNTMVFADAHHLLADGQLDCVDLPDHVVVMAGQGKTLIGLREFFDAGKLNLDIRELYERRQAFYASCPDYSGSESERLALLKAYSQLRCQIHSSCAEIPHLWSTPDRWPHRSMWLWDSVFHALGARHVSRRLAFELLLAVLDFQHEDGMISHQMDPVSRSSVSQPPILCWGFREVLGQEATEAELSRIVPRLSHYLQWFLDHRDANGNGLLEWWIDPNPQCRCGESGMDNSPRFDTHEVLDAVDLNSFMAQECECLAEFYVRLGRPEEAEPWQQRHDRLVNLINERMWSEADGFYRDYVAARDEQSPILASAGFLPLLCGAPGRKQAERLVAHLSDPQTFGTPTRVPSISCSQEKFYAKDMWRGPVWINLNYLIARGLERYGYEAESRQLMQETVDLETKNYLNYGTFFEFYDDRNECPPPYLWRKGCCNPNNPFHQSFSDYGWSGTLFIEMLARLRKSEIEHDPDTMNPQTKGAQRHGAGTERKKQEGPGVVCARGADSDCSDFSDCWTLYAVWEYHVALSAEWPPNDHGG